MNTDAVDLEGTFAKDEAVVAIEADINEGFGRY